MSSILTVLVCIQIVIVVWSYRVNNILVDIVEELKELNKELRKEEE